MRDDNEPKVHKIVLLWTRGAMARFASAVKVLAVAAALLAGAASMFWEKLSQWLSPGFAPAIFVAFVIGTVALLFLSPALVAS